MFKVPWRIERSRSPLLPGRHEEQSLSSASFYHAKRLAVQYQGLLVAVLYGVVSVSITVFNKIVLSHYHFNYSNALSLGQGLCSLLFLFGLRSHGIISFPNLSMRTAFELRWLVFSFIGMVLTGLASLAFVNIAMYSVLRRMATVVTLFGEKHLLGIEVPPNEAYSVYLMLGGALVAGWGDLEFHLLGYVLIAINCVFTAGYLLAIKRAQSLKLNVFGQMLYTNLFGAPIFFALFLLTESQGVLNYPYWTSPGFLFCFLMSSIHAFLLNWLIFLCSTINSPLTTSITGQLKNVATTLLGFVLFGGIAIGYDGIFGLFLSTVASVWYAYIKFRQTLQQHPQAHPVQIGEKFLRLLDDSVWIDSRRLVPVWALVYSFGLVYFCLLCFWALRSHRAGALPIVNRCLYRLCWIPAAGLSLLASIHFSNSLLGGTQVLSKSFATILVHATLFASQVAATTYYFLLNNPKFSPLQKFYATFIPTAVTSVVFVSLETYAMDAYWHLQSPFRSLGSMSGFWLGNHVFFTTFYTLVLLAGYFCGSCFPLPSPCLLDVHFMVMLAFHIVGVISRLGSLGYDTESVFGCISAVTFLAEYFVWVPSVFACSRWLFSYPPRRAALPASK